MNYKIIPNILVQVILVSVWSVPFLEAAKNEGGSSAEQPGRPIAVPDKIFTPSSGVELTGGILKTTFENNIQYLKNTYDVDDLLYCFRERAGDPDPPGKVSGMDGPHKLYGSVAGVFLMGSGNTLRWKEDAQLREMMNRLVDGIEKCKQPNDYIMAYPEELTGKAEYPNYVRSWLTHGLIEASIAGNSKALGLIRGHQDWFNQCEYLPLLRTTYYHYQGLIPNARMYFTSTGKTRDLEVLQKYYQEDEWLDQLIVGDDRAIHKRDHPHCYEITAFEAYLDLYRATGNKKYLAAMLSAQELIRDRWEHVGGSIAICEGKIYPPDSYAIENHTGEFCGSVFWTKFNQRFHRLYPEKEEYVNEIEKSIYNIGVANQVGSKGIFYHAHLHRLRGPVMINNSCCEGQATRLYGSLPEYVYSIAPDGLIVDMYADSKITWTQEGTEVTVTNSTDFPREEAVKLSVSVEKPVSFTLKLRMPSWLRPTVKVNVNGSELATGTPGTYCEINRQWQSGDTVSFSLPMDFKVHVYRGIDQVRGYDRYAIEYGPLLLGVVGPFDFEKTFALDENDFEDSYRFGIMIKAEPHADPATWLTPVPGKPLHFTVNGKPGYEYMPYYEIGQHQRFTCWPLISPTGGAY